MKKAVLVTALLVLLCAIPTAYSLQGKMPLLAVRQVDDGYAGSTAELTLEIKEGTGRVFVDTFPLSKIDTQISMRFAKEIACDYLDMDCENYDFVYTIDANSPIISGPSAGAAATVLTVSVLTGTPLKKDTAITGTINSGGLIGPVGGLKEKIEAGGKSGLKTILIPAGEGELVNQTENKTLTLPEYGKTIDVNTIEVSDLTTALETFTGKKFKSDGNGVSINANYTKIMRNLSAKLCDRNEVLQNSINTLDLRIDTRDMYDTAANLSKKGQDALKKEEYYAAASYCFGSNVRYNQVFLETKNFSEKKYRGLLDELSRNIESYEKEIDSKQIKTITDLESYMVTKERLIDAQSYTNSTLNGSLSYAYAYASERYISAQSWAEFFTHEGKVLEFNDATLKDSCQQRISEAEERLQYAALYIPFSLSSPRKELDNAYSDFSAQNYALCLFKASQAKAEVNIILNTLGVEAEYIPTLIDNKLAAAARVIRKGEKNGMFPILGYSYYEYANNLKDSDKFSSLLYSEYALELSNLDMYFKEEKRPKIKVDFSRVAFASTFLLVGAFLGAYIMAISIKKTIKTTISKKDDYKPSKTRSLAGKKR